jgi:hypothetical protein
MSEWLGDWTERAFAATSETVLDLIQEHAPGVAESKRLPRSVITRLRDAYGIDARDGRYIEALAKWAVYFAPQATLDTDIWGARETNTRRERLEQQRQDALGVGRPGSDRYRGLDDFARGPIQVHAFDEEPLTTVVQLDTEAWLDIDRRETAIRALQALGAIACSSRVFLEVDSLALFDSLTERFGDHLEMAGVDLNETRDRVHRRCDVSGTTATPADAEIVWSWLTDTRDDTSQVHVVKALSRSPQKTLTREELLHDMAVGFGKGSFYAVKDALVDAGLVEWVKRSGHDQSSRVVLDGN